MNELAWIQLFATLVFLTVGVGTAVFMHGLELPRRRRQTVRIPRSVPRRRETVGRTQPAPVR